MIVELDGVWKKTPGSGMCFLPLRYGEKIDTDNLPEVVGGVPIGRKSWYKSPPLEQITVVGESRFNDSGLCPMRGSKAGIASLEFSGRVMAYDYYFAEWAGRRFGEWTKRTGKRVLVVSSKKPRSEMGHHACDRIVRENLNDGFRFGMHGVKSIREAWDKGIDLYEDSHECQFIQRHEWRGGSLIGCSSFICLNLTGLDDQKRKSLVDMANNLSSIEAIQKAMENEL